MSSLLVRSPLRELESLRGYAMRMAHANKCTELIHPFLRSLGAATEALPILAALTTIDEARLVALVSMDDRYGPNRRLCRIGDAALGFRTVRWTERVVCPACVERSVFSSVLWELAVVSSCDVHRLDLVSKCPECAATLDWQRGHIGACPCGLALSRFQRLPAKAGAAALCRQIRVGAMSSVHSATGVGEVAVALDRLLLFVAYAGYLLEPIGCGMLDEEAEPRFSDQTCGGIAMAIGDPFVRALLAGGATEDTARLRLGRDIFSARQLDELNSLFAGVAPPRHQFVLEHLVARRQRWRSFAPALVGADHNEPGVP